MTMSAENQREGKTQTRIDARPGMLFDIVKYKGARQSGRRRSSMVGAYRRGGVHSRASPITDASSVWCARRRLTNAHLGQYRGRDHQPARKDNDHA
jgi:hypothetical protein